MRVGIQPNISLLNRQRLNPSLLFASASHATTDPFAIRVDPKATTMPRNLDYRAAFQAVKTDLIPNPIEGVTLMETFDVVLYAIGAQPKNRQAYGVPLQTVLDTFADHFAELCRPYKRALPPGEPPPTIAKPTMTESLAQLEKQGFIKQRFTWPLFSRTWPQTYIQLTPRGEVLHMFIGSNFSENVDWAGTLN